MAAEADIRAQWERRLTRAGLPAELTPDRPGGRALRVSIRSMALANDGVRVRPISIEHEHLSAAVWRFPFAEWAQARLARIGRGRRGTPSRLAAAMRRTVKTLAAGGTTRQAARRSRCSLRAVMEFKRAVMAWRDPDDE